MTKRISFIFFTVLLGVSIFNSCNQQFKPVVVDHQNSLLWQISKPGTPTSYMFGTMHMINKEFYNFSRNIKVIVKSSDAVIMELGGMPNPIQAMLLMTNKKGTLKDIFSTEQWQTILNFYKKEFDMTETKFVKTYNSFKPFFLFQSLTQAYFDKDAESYDLDIMQLTREQNIALIGLETIEEQVGFFDAIPNDEMATMIIESLKTYKEDIAEFEKLQQLYGDEKVDELIPLMKEQSPEFMKYEDLFLNNRNKKWIPIIKEKINSKSCFIAVGAAHLFENNGLIALLKAEGYTIKPIQK